VGVLSVTFSFIVSVPDENPIDKLQNEQLAAVHHVRNRGLFTDLIRQFAQYLGKLDGLTGPLYGFTAHLRRDLHLLLPVEMSSKTRNGQTSTSLRMRAQIELTGS